MIELSPFQVQASERDIGYFAENTLGGTRLNTRLADLGSSITVVTKQQLEDTAAVDLNDVFLYEANTEGTGQFTSYSVDRNGGVTDQVQSSPQTSTRVRGLGAPDIARDYFPSISRIPLDVYNIDSVTVNRGPNSILFGLGSASGIVNQSPAKAQLDSFFGTVTARVGSYGSHRGSFSVNAPVLEDRLAIYVAAVQNEERFRQEPAHDSMTRIYGAVTYKPFERTTLRFSYEDIYNDVHRPNAVTPRDYITPYRAAGSPTWNPVTYTATVPGGSQIVAETEALLPAGLTTDSNSPAFYIDRGEIYPTRIQRRLGDGYPGMQNTNQPERTVRSQHPYDANRSQYLLYVVPGITDPTLFDYSRINATSTNNLLNKAKIYSVNLEHEIIPNLFFEAGYYKEEFESMRLTALVGGSASVHIDPNVLMLDGSPNPYFGRAYAETVEPNPTSEPEDNEVMRATLAYELDLTTGEGWRKWLGRHRIMALAQKREIENRSIRYREATVSDHVWNTMASDNRWSGPNAQTRYTRRYYLGDQSGRILYGPGDAMVAAPGETFDYTLRHFLWNDANGDPVRQWTNESVTGGMIVHPSSSRTQRDVESAALSLQSYLWDDRIVATVGWRHDTNQARTSLGLSERDARGFVDLSPLNEFTDWQKDSGETLSTGIVFHATDWLSFHYNEAESFTPSSRQVNLYGEELPLPTGKGKDYGFSVTLLEDKLFARFNWYETEEQNSRSGADTGTITIRTRRVDTDYLIPFWEWQIRKRDTGEDGNLVSRGEAEAIHSPEVAELTGLPDFFFDNVTNSSSYNDTRTVESEGLEFSLIYNPVQNWNIKLNVTQQETIESEAAPNIPNWIAERMDVWMNTVGFDGTSFWDTPSTVYRGGGTTVPSEWFSSIVYAPLSFLRASEGKPRPQVREWRVNMITNYVFTEGAMEGIGFGGALRWEDKGAIGFKGISTGEAGEGVLDVLDPDQPVWDSARTSADFWVSYTTRLFEDRVRMKIQLNVRDAFESGGLRAVAVNPDGQASVHRIVQPRQFMLTSTFSF